MYKKAFTLSELLIALAIIGVILILTAPMTINNFNKKSLIVSLQRTYTAIGNAVDLMMMSERAKDLTKSTLYISSSSDTVTSTAGGFLTKYFKVLKDCETEPGDCFASSYVNLNKNTVTLPSKGNAYCVTISTGAAICITPPYAGGNACKVLVDVNGTSKPNIAGRDLFVFYIYMDGFVGDRTTDNTDNASFCRSSYGAGCLSILMNSDWIMDY